MRAAGNLLVASTRNTFLHIFLLKLYIFKLKLIFILSAGEIFSQLMCMQGVLIWALQNICSVCSTVPSYENPLMHYTLCVIRGVGPAGQSEPLS